MAALIRTYQLTNNTSARRQLADLEKSQAEVVSQRNQAEKHIAALEDKIHELEARLDEEGRDASQMEVLRVRLAEEMEDERNQHRQDIEERDFNIESMRKKYQGTRARV
jgi:myosin heavy chain 9/10/11/14